MPTGRYPRRARWSGHGLSPPKRRSAIAEAGAQLQDLKTRISRAALGCLRADLNAPVLVRQALDAVDEARAHLARAELAEELEE